MSNPKVNQSLENLGNALKRLSEALQEPDANSLIIDGTIQRFEFVIELFWKTLKRVLAEEGIETRTPRHALKEAFQAGWLSDETAWLQMLKDRNETSHIYNEEMATRIYSNIKNHYPELHKVYTFLIENYAFKGK